MNNRMLWAAAIETVVVAAVALWMPQPKQRAPRAGGARIAKPGPVEVLCNVHLEISAYIMVLRNPYFAVSAADGTYEIANVPSGRHRVRCWSETGAVQEREATVGAGETVTVDFRAEERALGSWPGLFPMEIGEGPRRFPPLQANEAHRNASREDSAS